MDQLPDKLISAYLEGGLDQAQAAELSRWVLASEENALYLASLAALEHGLAKHARMQSNSDILAELQQAEEQGEDLDPMALAAERFPTPPNEALTRDHLVSALSYVIKHNVTPRRIAAIASIAAAVLIGATLLFVLTGNGNAPSPQPVATPGGPGHSAPGPAGRIVAALTAEHNAVWDRRPGEDLYAGQRFTLKQGLAEVTTARGAVAVIEAPASIELLNNPNAIRLHTGRLVGICETAPSKGFMVRTPHTDVTDLGTRFGVDATRPSASEVHVFEGEVGLSRAAPEGPANTVTARLTKGQASSIDTAGRVTRIEAETLAGFAGPETLALMGVLSPRQRWVQTRDRLMRDPSVIAVAPFIRPGSDWPDGFGYGRLRLYDSQYLTEQSQPREALFAEPVAWRGDRGIGGSIVLGDSGAVFIDLDTAPGGRPEVAGLIDGNGLIGRPGTTLYIAWRMQGGGVGLDPEAYAGLSLMRGDRSKADEPLFIGCAHASTDWSVHPRQVDRNQLHNSNAIRSLTGPGSNLRADADAHLWLVRIEFAQGPDHVSVYLDPDLDAPKLPEPNLQLNDYDAAFDRLRFAIGDGAKGWRFDDVVISTTRPRISSGTAPDGN